MAASLVVVGALVAAVAASQARAQGCSITIGGTTYDLSALAGEYSVRLPDVRLVFVNAL